MTTSDPYSRVDYRRVIAWTPRIEREWPLLERVLLSGPSTRVLDLGCGTGEHSRFLHANGFEVIGVDRSASMIATAMDRPVPDGLDFVEGDLQCLPELVDGPFGGAICLGNTLPHLASQDALTGFLAGLRTVLAPGAAVLLQLLGYDRIFARRERVLPVNVRPGDDGEEIVFVRVMTPGDDGSVRFYPTTLSLRDDRDPPIEVVRSRRVELRGWRSGELEAAFRDQGFLVEERLGSFELAPYDPESSRDFVLVARNA